MILIKTERPKVVSYNGHATDRLLAGEHLAAWLAALWKESELLILPEPVNPLLPEPVNPPSTAVIVPAGKAWDIDVRLEIRENDEAAPG